MFTSLIIYIYICMYVSGFDSGGKMSLSHRTSRIFFTLVLQKNWWSCRDDVIKTAADSNGRGSCPVFQALRTHVICELKFYLPSLNSICPVHSYLYFSNLLYTFCLISNHMPIIFPKWMSTIYDYCTYSLLENSQGLPTNISQYLRLG